MGTSLKIRQKAIPWKRVNDNVVGPYKVENLKGQRTLESISKIDPARKWLDPSSFWEQGIAIRKTRKVWLLLVYQVPTT